MVVLKRPQWGYQWRYRRNHCRPEKFQSGRANFLENVIKMPDVRTFCEDPPVALITQIDAEVVGRKAILPSIAIEIPNG